LARGFQPSVSHLHEDQTLAFRLGGLRPAETFIGILVKFLRSRHHASPHKQWPLGKSFKLENHGNDAAVGVAKIDAGSPKIKPSRQSDDAFH
jgi:hypothetical protein